MPDLNVVLQGKGTPEAVVEALPGQRYFDETNNDLYLKEQGDGKFGWVKAGGSGGGGGAVGLGDFCLVRGYADGPEQSELLKAIAQSALVTSSRGTSITYEPAKIAPVFGASPQHVMEVHADGIYEVHIRAYWDIPQNVGGDIYDVFEYGWFTPDGLGADPPVEELLGQEDDTSFFYHRIIPNATGTTGLAINCVVPPALIPAGYMFRPELGSTIAEMYSAYVKVVRLG
jgi:hypothetical protein